MGNYYLGGCLILTGLKRKKTISKRKVLIGFCFFFGLLIFMPLNYCANGEVEKKKSKNVLSLLLMSYFYPGDSLFSESWFSPKYCSGSVLSENFITCMVGSTRR